VQEVNDSPTLTQARHAMEDGSVDPIELVDGCIAAIDRREGELQAWVHVDRNGARAAARELTGARRGGAVRGPLFGIPFGIKDIIDVAGMPTRAGSPLRQQHVADADADIVARLRAAGAIMLGKTVTTQFACFDPPETRNPWNPERTPGGSSSGSAVAVATGMCLAALGTQTGGSIIRPAAYCGVVGLKPTWGAWSMQGIVPVSFQLDHVGPLATGIEDIWHIWRAVSGGSPGGPAELLPPERAPILHLPTGSFLDPCDRTVWSVFEASVRRLAAQGATVVREELPSCLEDALRMHRRIMVVELAQYHSQAFAKNPSQYAAGIAELIREGWRTPATDYAVARRHREMCMAAIDQVQAEEPRLWITPATTSVAPGRATTGSPALNSPWSYCGLPAVTFPSGGTHDGLPVGLQLVGRRQGESSLLEAARWCEAALGAGRHGTVTGDKKK
jgi:aspartyl-tRNA(Asn)/glutamyl-tRNA(Gln) amidotransferase subunit A